MLDPLLEQRALARQQGAISNAAAGYLVVKDSTLEFDNFVEN
jgi:hypothetical protein